MQRVYVAWDAEEARRFLRVLQSHGISGRVIEDRDFHTRDEGVHDTEGAPEVWISDAEQLARATELAQGFESKREAATRKEPDEDAEPDAAAEGVTESAPKPATQPEAGGDAKV